MNLVVNARAWPLCEGELTMLVLPGAVPEPVAVSKIAIQLLRLSMLLTLAESAGTREALAPPLP